MATDLGIEKPLTRSARFDRTDSPQYSPTDVSGRRAAFRPSEVTAVRRDVVEAFRQSALADVHLVTDSQRAKRCVMTAAALAEEALGRPVEALAQYGRVATEFGVESQDWAAKARVLRAQGDQEAYRDLLALAAIHTKGHVFAFEAAQSSWELGDSCEAVMHRLDTAAVHTIEDISVGVSWRAAQLTADLMAEQGRWGEATQVLDRLASHPGMPREDQVGLRAMLAAWSHVLNGPAEARSRFAALADDGVLDSSHLGSLAALEFELGDAQAAVSRLRQSDELGVADALALGINDVSPVDSDDETRIFRTWKIQALEVGQDREALISELNLLLETSLDTATKVHTLFRLGRLYETVADLHDAAAEVYREALSLAPDHAPTLRALGRIYGAQGEFEALADLYEREIASLEGAPSVWRRHYQVAEIYETHLGRLNTAVGHYHRVLEQKPNYLPALKGAARVLGKLNKWTELADLFLLSVANAPSRRQKLYLLDKVADVAERQLQNTEVAIGAWEEILHLAPEHPQAFSALGRLYASTKNWAALVSLNERELELIEDPEESAALLVRNAEIVMSHAADVERGERYLRRALELAPDFLPALELLGRVYARGGRWAEIVGMTGQQLAKTADVREALRLMGALAELFELRLGSSERAMDVYEKMLTVDPENTHAAQSWMRLAMSARDWTAVSRAQRVMIDATGDAFWVGFAATVDEWKTGRIEQAYHGYMKALARDPGNVHWLAGVGRTWARARVDAGAIARHLEDFLMSPMPSASRDAYFLLLARLKERSTHEPDAGLAYRAHGDSSHPENQAVLRLAMAAEGDRAGLVEFRENNPLSQLDKIWAAELVCEVDSFYLRSVLGPQEREQFLAMLPPKVALVVKGDRASWQVELGCDLARILGGETLPESAASGGLRLRAVDAWLAGDVAAYGDWTRAEVNSSDSVELKILRLVEWAEYDSALASTLLKEAVDQAFPTEVTAHDAPCLDRLYDALDGASEYELLRFSLEAHVSIEGISQPRRVSLFAKLARILEEEVNDAAAARTAYLQCWQLSENRGYLLDLVRVASGEGDHEAAVRFQTAHYEDTIHCETAELEDRLVSAMELAKLLVAAERGAEAVRLLEEVAHYQGEGELFYQTKRNLAQLHVAYGDASRAADLLEEILPFTATQESLADWHTLVRLHWRTFGDLSTAYALQWKLVRALPHVSAEVHDLIELAIDIDELSDCCKELEKLADEIGGELQAVLIGLAAETVDEEINWAEEACRLYRRAIEVAPEDLQLHYRRRYAFALSRITGKEAEALECFRALAILEPFEPSTYRGLSDLSNRVHAHDRSRIAKDVLAAIGYEPKQELGRGKVSPSRALSAESVADSLLPDALQDGVFEVIRQGLAVVEKIWADTLPQRKAMIGERVKDPKVLGYFSDGFALFGFKRVKLMQSDDAVEIPQVFHDSTPEVWVSTQLLERGNPAELRFIAGWAAALAWSQMVPITHVDGRQVWHMLEGAVLKQTGRGFSDRVDAESQRFGAQLAGPFHTVTRRRITHAVENCNASLNDAHCEAWPEAVRVMAARAGLICCGDVESALGASLKLEGWLSDLTDVASQKRLRKSPIVQELIAFALSDAFLQLRYEVGLSGRPSRLSV